GGAACSATIGALAVFRVWPALPWWLLPALVSWSWGRLACEAMAQAVRLVGKPRAAALGMLGGALIVFVPPVAVKQPWALALVLPDANGAELDGLDLGEIFLDGCSAASFRGANLDRSDLSFSQLGGCELSFDEASLRQANLSGASLDGATFRNVDLSGANLDGVSAYMVDFRGANMQRARLQLNVRGRVNMSDASLEGADLSGLSGVDRVTSWKGAKYDNFTVWPQGVEPSGIGAIRVETIN
ncbi:MAG: pentapeptide repeat-containing protein, partial [Polyangiaceae bacterium]|nr:pentapeptide repeat-containing protein [Polyangiaceae bacterium]